MGPRQEMRLKVRGLEEAMATREERILQVAKILFLLSRHLDNMGVQKKLSGAFLLRHQPMPPLQDDQKQRSEHLVLAPTEL